uniref:Uncharacterized protein n=1 Tax=Arion vulgaris TaxID=1028688 RepID=A0A0B7AP34_9EUPU
MISAKVNSEVDDEDEDISTSEDDFEQISRADVEDLKETEEVKASDSSLLASQKEAGVDNEIIPQEMDNAEDCGEFPS